MGAEIRPLITFEEVLMPRHLITNSRGNLGAIVRRAGERTHSRHDTRIVIEAGTSDPVAVSEAIREWIVPVLVRGYLAERAAAATCLAEVNMKKLDTGTLGKEQRVNPATSR